jgi:transcriptional regulator with XRE-family HTH domain
MDDAKLAATIGKSARAARVALGLSQADVAEKLGLSLEFVGRIERGVALPSVPTLVSLAAALAISSDMMLGIASERTTRTHQNPPPPEQSRIRRLLDRRLNRAPDSALRVVNLLLAEFESSAKTSRRNVHRAQKVSKKSRKG